MAKSIVLDVIESTPVGRVAAVTRGGEVVAIEIIRGSIPDIMRRMSGRFGDVARGRNEAGRQLREYFAGRRRKFALKATRGLNEGFRKRVLEACARIPYGRTATYGELAAAAGSPRAARAAGSAIASNPSLIVIPCHRVTPAAGGLGGYSAPGGSATKRKLLAMEGVAVSGKSSKGKKKHHRR